MTCMWEARPVDETDYLGMVGEAARAKAELDGWLVRVYRQGDGLRADFRPNRLNFQIDDAGTVTQAKVF